MSAQQPQGETLFDLYIPKIKPIGILSIPHSGEVIPEEFLEFLTDDQKALACDVDTKVDELVDIEKLRDEGVIVQVAKIHRTCVDLNRSEDLAVLAWENNSQGVNLVQKRPDEENRQRLLGKFYHPYYQTLKSSVDEVKRVIGKDVPFIDLHSMPSKPTAYHMKQNPNQDTHRPDFCLSDQHGKTCIPEYINYVKEEFEAKGYEAYINKPYVGGHITVWVGDLETNNIQIETNRRIYLNEETKEMLDKKTGPLKEDLTDIILKTLKKFS